MCTAATYKTKDFYFGRTLDYEYSYNEEVTITPRNFPFTFRSGLSLKTHHAIIGLAFVMNNTPLYYDEKMNLTDIPFSRELPTAQLHWIIAGHDEAITVESVKDGIHIYPNPAGVLTNNPPFETQMFMLNNFMHVSPRAPENGFSDKLELNRYSRGMGGMGLPGDLSSHSRFVRVAFTKLNSRSDDSEAVSVSQFFHILGSVDQTRGLCDMGDGKFEITIYTSCCNADKGIYYYTTYDNHRISGVDMHRENLDSDALIRYPLVTDDQILMQN